eukprot:TRINITY_DN1251_c0_g1_i1.p1 TRINITY_DN1251_c0_g1~~TRINITY_DN1251_c0_g1_i1.p1  ORF type:complete len:606 (+),score=172.36 TRINITY_DN1251_c0_g1_i1:167-1984(+)
MPTINVPRDHLFKAIGKTYTDDEFRNLCFDFGIELDDITSEREIAEKETRKANAAESDEVLYKIEVPANRYDLLCLEGIAQALRVFERLESPPKFHYVGGSSKPKEKLIVKAETAQVRPHVVAAVLRNVTFTPQNYKSFIDLQDKLHQNVGRRRTLVSLGTHDLDTIKGPFTYEALPPQDISFVPLNDTQKYNGVELFAHLDKQDSHLKKFLSIIRNSPVYPVIYDSNRVVLSLPPIINGDHSKITLNTKNIFIEVTATDLTKAEIALNMIVAAFSEYASDKYSVEPVEIVLASGETKVTPTLASRTQPTSIDYITKSLGIAFPPQKLLELLTRMSLPGSLSEDGSTINVSVPITRSDVLHECDIMEDVAIAHGYDNLVIEAPKTVTIGKQQPINKLTDLLRQQLAQAGYIELLTFALVARNENYEFLNRPEDGKAVILSNPVSAEFQIVRTSLLVGLLKTLKSNRRSSLPIKVYEISDVVVQTDSTDVGSKNIRRLGAAYCSHTSGFGDLHGMLDRLMLLLGVTWDKNHTGTGYYLQKSEDPTFFPGMRADVILNGSKIGTLGVIHPTVLARFKIPHPVSAMEIDIEQFKKKSTNAFNHFDITH